MNEKFTTKNMNEIVTPIYEAMKAGNPVAKLVFDLNDAINALKPGRPISKDERARIEFMWDNLLVGIANDAVDSGEGIPAVLSESSVSEGIKFNDDRFEAVLLKWHNAYKELNKTNKESADKVTKDADKSGDSLQGGFSPATIKSLEAIVNAIGVDNAANILGIDKDIIVAAMRRDEGAEEALLNKLSPNRPLTGLAVDASSDGSAKNKENVSDKESCDGKCGKSCKGHDEDSCDGKCGKSCKCQDEDSELIDAVKKILELCDDEEDEEDDDDNEIIIRVIKHYSEDAPKVRRTPLMSRIQEPIGMDEIHKLLRDFFKF